MTQTRGLWIGWMMGILVIVGGSTGLHAEETPASEPSLRTSAALEALLQIGGHFCEHRRSEVADALQRVDTVQHVEFLNQHGTVLVRYQQGATTTEHLADAVERALAMGRNCK